MICPKCMKELILHEDYEDDEIKWESYECSDCRIEVIKYIK